MYKCTECGCEFEIKPDFCDCGNDEFVITLEEKQKVPESQHKIQENIETQNKDTTKIVNNVAHEKNENEKIQPKIFHPLLSSLEPISVSIFLICIVLSIVIICIKPKEPINSQNAEKKEEEIVKKAIPNIDKFWNNAVNEAKKDSLPEKNKSQNQIKIEVKIPVKKEIKPQTTKTTVVPIKKTTQKTTKTQTIQKTDQNKTPITQAKTTKAQQTIKSQAQKQQNTAETVSPQTVQTAQTVPVTVQKVNSEASKKELANYKARLRNTIGQKIDFTQVVGDGNCTVSFKISSTGKLINRSFSQQSSNITLNDAVYKAVMSTPTYNAPPEAYNNETLNLNIKFYNGNFEISLQ